MARGALNDPVRELVLVRHAHAHAAEPGLEDFERRLDRRGRGEAETMAARAAALGLAPAHLISSPADRAIATARQFAKALGFPLPRIRHDDRVYLAEREQLVAILRALPDAPQRVMLVGHNPGLSALAEWLTDEDVDALATGSFYVARGPLAHWANLARGALEPAGYEQPR